MPKQKRAIRHAEIVTLFATRLRQLRSSRGMTQADLAHEASITVSYVWKLETGKAAPGIDLVARLAKALGTSVHDLLPSDAPVDPLPLLRDQAKKLFDGLLETADRESLLMLNPLLARLLESPTRRR